MTTLTLTKSDITTQKVDCIVNAANSSLLGGGGVDGAIHRAAGPELLAECKTLGACEVGDVRITKGYNLPAKFVIHTVGPFYDPRNNKIAEKLANCYANSLKLAKQNEVKTIAFPAISTGVYGYPVNEASKIAVETVRNYIAQNPNDFDEIRFVAFTDEVYNAYEQISPGIKILQTEMDNVAKNKTYTVKTKPEKCLHCNSQKVVPILYGLYEPTLEDMVEAAKPDYVQKFALGGCVTTGHDPKWQCLDCETKYYEEK